MDKNRIIISGRPNNEGALPLNETELVRRAQAGDWQAFELLLERYRGILARTAYLTTRDRESVQDIVQEALVQIWQGLSSYRPFGSLKAWMVKIVINQARKHYRRKRVETVPLEAIHEMSGSLDGPEEAAIQQDEAHLMRVALEALNADHREVLVLRYYADLTVPEIARVLACREGTVKSRLNRALGRLEEVLASDHRWPQEVADES
ncbi:MAG: sigma-70 family RNA polymerase sigma factor [Chloroflexi bacterium]|nr:sigma-70 family RNA polymerase sigma factor [Chloroflexota bacterium]